MRPTTRTFRLSVLQGLALSVLSGVLVKEIWFVYQNSPQVEFTRAPGAVSPPSEDRQPVPTPLAGNPSEPSPPSSGSGRSRREERWSILLPPETEMVANYERWMAGILNDQPSSISEDQLAISPVVSSSLKGGVVPESLPGMGIKAIAQKTKLETGQRVEWAQSPVENPAVVLSPDATPENSQPFQPTQLPLSPPPQPPAASSPSTTLTIPSAYGQQWGKVGIGLGIQSRTRYTNQADGGLGIGIGLGNPQTGVGVDVGINILDLVGNTAQEGSVSLKIHRQLPQNWAIAVGVQNAIQWGNTDGGSSVYGVVSKRFDLRENISEPFSRVYASVGVGGGQFRSEDDILQKRNSIGVFGSVAVRVIPPVNAIAEWNGQDLNLGVSVTPFPNLPLVITPALTDITGNAGDGSRLTVGVGYVISF